MTEEQQKQLDEINAEIEKLERLFNGVEPTKPVELATKPIKAETACRTRCGCRRQKGD